MRPEWYADKRDLLKWAVLYHLAEENKCNRILQIAFYRDSQFGKIMMDGQETEIPQEVISYFRGLKDLRNILNLKANFKIDVFMETFKDRKKYIQSVKEEIARYINEKLVVFLDPDTGLKLKKPKLEHVSGEDVKEIWNSLKPEDVLVFYQHKSHERECFGKRRSEFEKAINAIDMKVKIAKGPAIAKDVVFFYVQKR